MINSDSCVIKAPTPFYIALAYYVHCITTRFRVVLPFFMTMPKGKKDIFSTVSHKVKWN